ncbi:MAG: 4Fe-4S dicluster domain-containing protein [Bacteroidales bacterium]|nr:4Fe-4S dicluster domain-containing protein [Bacteroidales bacterium]
MENCNIHAVGASAGRTQGASLHLRGITAVFFSPCSGTAGRVGLLCSALAQRLGLPVRRVDYTLPAARVQLPPFGPYELVVWGSPVYAGRLPNKLKDYVEASLRGEGSPFVGLVTFGNRSHGDALSELVGLARRGGLRPIGAAALAMPHVFSALIAAGRPTAADDEGLLRFADAVAEAVVGGVGCLPPFGNESPDAYYTPLRVDGSPARFLKATPQADVRLCTRCGLCATVCPMGSVSMEGLPRFGGVCIKCQACISACRRGALSFADGDFRSHVAMLEQTFTCPAPNVFYTLQ